jgi:hypothetical protein
LPIRCRAGIEVRNTTLRAFCAMSMKPPGRGGPPSLRRSHCPGVRLSKAEKGDVEPAAGIEVEL